MLQCVVASRSRFARWVLEMCFGVCGYVCPLVWPCCVCVCLWTLSLCVSGLCEVNAYAHMYAHPAGHGKPSQAGSLAQRSGSTERTCPITTRRVCHGCMDQSKSQNEICSLNDSENSTNNLRHHIQIALQCGSSKLSFRSNIMISWSNIS